MGGKAKGPGERKGGDGCILLLGRSHQGRAEAVDTLTMISHSVEISIARGGVDEKDETSALVDRDLSDLTLLAFYKAIR